MSEKHLIRIKELETTNRNLEAALRKAELAAAKAHQQLADMEPGEVQAAIADRDLQIAQLKERVEALETEVVGLEGVVAELTEDEDDSEAALEAMQEDAGEDDAG